MTSPDTTVEKRYDAAALLAQARRARAHSYSPYSRFPVGAALLDAAGQVHRGANVENASYGLATCAERVALTAAVAAGVKSFVAIAVVGPEGREAIPPCGSCRQILHEFAPGLDVVMAGESGEARVVQLAGLIPEAFGPPSPGERGDG